MSTSLVQLINSNLSQIHEFARDIDFTTEGRYYAQALAFSLTGDQERLEEHFKNSSQILSSVENDLKNELIELVSLRLKILSKQITTKDITHYTQLSFREILEAEKLSLLGVCSEQLKDDLSNRDFCLKAASLYRKNKCARKAARLFYNSIVADSRLYPYKSFISEYQAVIEMTKKTDDASLSGLCLVMLSREYQIVQLPQKAFEAVCEGVQLLEAERGGIHYFHALLQKAHLLFEMKQLGDCQKILLECKMSMFKEIQAASSLMDCLINPDLDWNHELEQYLLPTWKERLSDVLSLKTQSRQNSGLQVTVLEEKLLKILWTEPHDKWDLIYKLYPDQKNSQIIENRFKNLSARVRKKFPDTLLCSEGRYYIKSKHNLMDKINL